MPKVILIANKDNNFYNFRSELILRLVELKFDVLLVCPYGKKIDFFTERGCRFFDIDVDRRGKSIFKDLKLIKAYKKLIKEEKPDIVLTYTTKSSIYGGIACQKYKIPYIVNNAGLAQTSGMLEILMKFLYKTGFKRASCLMFQNDQEKEYILRLFKKKTNYQRIPGSGVNLETFKYEKYPDSDGTVIFNFVARIVDFKGIDEYLECAKIIHAKHPNTVFRIFGDYDDNTYKPIIEELSKKGIVEYCGVMVDMKPWIKECHAVIHPSHYEGMTNVVLEHSAMGRPCIGSNIPGVMDGIDDGETGFVFKAKCVNSLVGAVTKFLNLDNQAKKEMGLKARIKMEKQFDRNIVTHIYISEIVSILEQRSAK